MLESICPILPSRDFDGTSAFYQQLGFSEVARFEKEGYLILVRDRVELHFYRHPGHDPASGDHGAFIRVENAEALSASFERLGMPADGTPSFASAEIKPWGVCELAITDPDGNLLRMGHIAEA